MSTVKNFSATSSAVVDSASVNWNDHSGSTAAVSGSRQMLVGFDADAAFTGDEKYREVLAGTFAAFLYGGSGAALRVYELQGAFDEEVVTYNTLPPIGYPVIGDLVPDGASGYNAYKSVSVGSRQDQPLAVLRCGVLLRPYSNGGATVDTSRGSHPPTLQVTLGEVCGLDAVAIDYRRMFRAMTTRVTWSARCTKPTYAIIDQASAVLRWRRAAGETAHEIQISGSQKFADVPAGTFGGVSIYDTSQMTTPNWYLSKSGSTFTVADLGASTTGIRTIVLPCQPSTEYHIRSGIPGTMRVAAFTSSVAVGKTSSYGVEVTSSSAPCEATVTTNTNSSRLVIQFFVEGDVTTYGATLDKALTGVIVETTPLSSVQLQVSVTSTSGITTTTEWTTRTIEGNGFTLDCSPSDGFVGKAVANTFRWAPVLSTGASGATAQTAAIFRWRPVGGAAASAALTTEQSVTLPAGTFATDAVEWMVESEINGTRLVSDWMELSTVEALPTATPLSPVSTLVDGSAPVLFRWLHEITTGTAPTGADLQISTDGGDNWTLLAHVSGSDTSYDAPAGTLSAGDTLWRVRSYNTDAAAGSWSAAAQIVVVAAPAAPSVSADATPRPLISWQADGQQGYEIRIDGETVRRDWGTASSWQAEEILADGTHLVEVRVQNAYGLWSDYGSAAIEVENVPGGDISLTLSGSESVALSWTASGYSAFRILRDGAQIAVTEGTTFLDERCSAGLHSYQIVGLLTGGYFALSNEIATNVSIPCPMLQDVARGIWLRLPAALQGQTAISDGWAPDVALVRYSGRGYPTAEIGAARSRTVTLRPAFPAAQREAAEALAGLVGKLLFYRDPRGAAFPAVITQLTGEAQRQYFTFNLTLTEVDGGVDDA